VQPSFNNRFEKLRKAKSLPEPSTVGRRLLDLSEDDSTQQLIDTILADRDLARRVVDLARRWGGASTEPLETLGHVARALGNPSLRSIAFALSLLDENREGPCTGFDYDGFWSRALATACIAEAIAAEQGSLSPEEAFTGGLLCDLGKLALSKIDPERYAEILVEEPETDRDLAARENQLLGIEHAEVGATLLVDWGFPQVLVEAVLEHELDVRGHDGGAGTRMASVLRTAKHVADLMVRDQSIDDDEWWWEFLALEELAGELDLPLDRLCSICDEAGLAWIELGGKLSVATHAAPALGRTASRFQRKHRRRPARGEADESPGVSVDLPLLAKGAAAGRPTRILIIDDDERMLRLLRHHLVKNGFEVFSVRKGEEGLHLALELHPQIVITDWMMPGMSGVKLCEALGKTETGRKVYKLMVTAREDDEQVVEAFEAGADDYVVKPFNPRILLARVRAGVRMVQMREKVEESERVRQRQVAELGILNRRLRNAAMTDPLTELPNRRYAMSRLKQEWQSVVRTGRPLSVVMLDVDNFKKVNDECGHDVGDIVLRETASVLRSITRQSDVLCRVGGEEFLCINVGSALDDAAECAERLRRCVESHVIDHGSFKQQHITCSFGVAERGGEMACFDDLLKLADQALYEAKQAGKNRVVARRWGEGERRRTA